jgi:integrase
MFFEWLCQQPGYRRKIDARYPQYLKPMAKEQHKAQISSPREIPTLEYVVALAGSIKGKSDVDSRDRALISFLAMTGMRDAAVITLPLGCYDAGTNIVSQDPRKGVRTKFNKHIVSIVFPFRAELQHHWQQWLGRLHELGYQEKDPLFPRTVVEKVAHGLCYCNSDNVEPVFWSCTQSLRNVLKRRSQQAGLKYHPPHSYRHLAIRSAFDLCDGSGIHFKAVSQNFGHNDVMMTIGHYGDLEQSELLVVLNQLISTTDREYRKEHRETVTVPREAAELIARAIKGM